MRIKEALKLTVTIWTRMMQANFGLYNVENINAEYDVNLTKFLWTVRGLTVALAFCLFMLRFF